MSITEEIFGRARAAAPRRCQRAAAACCWSGTHPTSTWDSARSSVAVRPPHTGPASTRSAAGCCAAPPNFPHGRPDVRSSPRQPSSPTSPPAAPTSCARGSRRCVTSVSRSSPSRRSTTTATSTPTCSPTSRCAASEGLAGVMVASADGQAFREPLEEIAARRGPGPGARISRTCQLGASVGYLGVRRPGGHSWCLPGTTTANRPRFAARAGRVAAAVPAAVLAADLARLEQLNMRGSHTADFS